MFDVTIKRRFDGARTEVQHTTTMDDDLFRNERAEPRDKLLAVRATKREKKRAESTAQDRGLTVSGFIRNLIRKELEKDR